MPNRRWFIFLKVTGLLLIAALFFHGCKSKQKTVSLSKTDSEVSISSVDETTTFGESYLHEEIVRLTRIDEKGMELIEIKGPAEIDSEGNIRTTSPETTVRKFSKNEKAKTVKEDISRKDSVKTQSVQQSKTDSTAIVSEKKKDTFVEKQPKLLAMLGLIVIIVTILGLLWRYVIEPKLFR